MDESGEHGVELVEAREYPPEALEPAKESLHLVASFVKFAVIFPRVEAVGLGRHDGLKLHVEDQLSGFVTLVSAIHDDGPQRGRALAPMAQELAAFRAIRALTCGEGET